MADNITTLINISQDENRYIDSAGDLDSDYLLYMVDKDGGSNRDKAVTLDALTNHVIGENDYKVKTSSSDGDPDYLAGKLNPTATSDGTYGDVKFSSATLKSGTAGIEGEVQHLGDVNLTGAMSGAGSISITGDAEAANVTVTKGGTLTTSKANGPYYVRQTEIDGEIELTNTAYEGGSTTITASSIGITDGNATTTIGTSQTFLKDVSDDNSAFLTAEHVTFNNSLSSTTLTASATMNSTGFAVSSYEYDESSGESEATDSMTLSATGFVMESVGDSHTESVVLDSSSFRLSYGSYGGGNSTTMTGDSVSMASSNGTTLTLAGGDSDPTATLTNEGLTFSDGDGAETLSLDGANGVVTAGTLKASNTLSTTAGLLVGGTATVSGSATFGNTVTSSYTGSPYWAFRNNNFLSLDGDSDALLTYDVVTGGLVFVANTGSSSIGVTVYDDSDGTTYEHTVSRRHAATFLCVGSTSSGAYPVFKMLG